MKIERKGDDLVITVPVTAAIVAGGHPSASGKSWVIDAAKLQNGEITAQVSVYQRNAPVAAAKTA